jgi:hypothetical protein
MAFFEGAKNVNVSGSRFNHTKGNQTNFFGPCEQNNIVFIESCREFTKYYSMSSNA